MADNDVVIRVKVEDDGSTKFFNDLGEEIGSIDAKTEQAQGGFSRLEAKLVTLNSVVGLAQAAFNTLSSVAGGAIDAISRGADIDDISSSFQNLATQAGASGDALLNKLNTALSNTIPNVELMQKANELLIGGLAPKDIENVAIAARALGEATGVNAAQGMDQLADSLLRGNDRALKTLGIVIDNKKVEEEYAASLGKTREALTEQERVMATREASLKALAENTARLGQVSDDAGDKINQIGTALTNARDQLFKTVSTNKELNEALGSLSKLIGSIDFGPLISGISSVITLAVKGASAILSLKSAIDSLVRPVEKATGDFNRYQDVLKGTNKAIADLFRDIGNARTKDDIRALSERMAQLNQHLSKFPADEATKMLKQLGDAGNLAYEKMQGLPDTLEDLNRQSDTFSGNFEQVAEKLRNTAEEGAKIGPTVKKSIDEAAASAKANPIEVDISFIPGIGGMLDAGGLLTGGAGDDLFSQIGESISGAILNGIKGGFSAQDGASLLGDIGQIIFKDSSFGKANPFLGPLIDVGTSLLGSAIESLFGGEDAGTTARKAADKFFADAFDAQRLSVIINGQLVQIEDLVFKGNTLFGGNAQFEGGGFADFLLTLPDAVQQAFLGVGTAFEELLGVSDDISGQIGAVLANNIGGSLNNLQLLVEASGKSFEELHGGIVDAFLDGKLSALEAQSALNGLAQVAQKGIPDAIGATVQAFDNLKAAGSKGGRAVIDALKDIGFEAKELGITTLPALMAQLGASGQFTAEEIQQVFDALGAQGIDTIEELTNATNEQLIAALSQLQVQQFPFAAAADDAAGLVDTLDRLPSEKTLTFNIKTNFDSNTQQAIKNGQIPINASQVSVSGPPQSV